MRFLLAAPVLGLSLLAGCAQPQHILSEAEGTGTGSAASVASLRDAPARYTDHAPAVSTKQVVPLVIDKQFSAEDRGKILAAVDEWNRVLNGAARFEVASPETTGGWWIVMSRDGVLPSQYTNPQPLATNMRLGKTGGMIIVFVNRIKDPTFSSARNLDLRGLMVQELGTALGGGNGSILYTAHVQDCIDKNMAMSVGSVLEIPAAQLNWCEPGASVAAR